MIYYSHAHHRSTLDVSQMANPLGPRQHVLSSSPAGSPALPHEDSYRPSLPSIASLIGIADGERPQDHSQDTSTEQWQTPQTDTITSDYHMHRFVRPPTPSMKPDLMYDTGQSPSTISTHSSFSGMTSAAGTAADVYDPYRPHHQIAHSPMLTEQSMLHYNMNNCAPPQAAVPMGNYMPTGAFQYTSYQQKPHPSTYPNFGPPLHSQGLIGSTLPWDQQQYYNLAVYNPPEKYICSSCNKAFSRPSSLRIHQYSHTGEKPWRCSHAGCGKAFSVRSNMKRHERGCHPHGSV